VVADHLRSCAFLIADGVMPSNEGRGYVLRRIMRRAMRHARLLGARDPLMHRMVPALVREMGAAYPELLRAQPLIEDSLLREEIAFRRTLENGLKLLDTEIARLQPGEPLPGEAAFKLYDTYGFPYDLTEDALRARSMTVDRAGFDAAMSVQKAAARAAWKGSGEQVSDSLWFDIAEREGASEFTGYFAVESDAVVVAIVRDGAEVQTAGPGDTIAFVANQTPFYAESGGQMGDIGIATGTDDLQIEVTDTAKVLGRLHVHHARVVSGTLNTGQSVHLVIDNDRRARLRANHSATHLLHRALRDRLGKHVTQKGSLVAPDRLRFDFSHTHAVAADDIAAIESAVNAQILRNAPVSTRLMSPDEAIEAGALALFGEKYGDEVRVLSMGKVDGAEDYSVELCGGTHVMALGDIGLMTIISESAVASGIRRIEALTGEGARLWLQERNEQMKSLAALLKTPVDDVPERVRAIAEERKSLERELAAAKKALALAGNAAGGGGPEKEDINGITFAAQVLRGLDPKELRALLNDQIKALGSGIAAIIVVNDGKASCAVAVSDDLTERFSAVMLVQLAVAELGGNGGGGRPNMAQGGGPDAEKAEAAIAAIRAAVLG
jgi:alanyl-tRNA synthetase